MLVSTDKAVAPATVMGASKALAEFALEAASARLPGTHYNAVRFGNVLGSSGSVVPIFRRQIARGGPVTVTDERMTRYFMTIPEAVHLIIRSGALGDPNQPPRPRRADPARAEVFVLDMGEPVRIVELARAMIELSGLDPDRDIDIEIVGARGGEKLHEQLFNSYERSRPTAAEKILLAEREPLAAEAVEAMFAEIGLLVLEGDAAGLAAKVSELSAAAREAPEVTRRLARAQRRGPRRARAEIRRSRATRVRLRPSYTPRIHDGSACSAIAFEHVHEDRRDRGVRRAGRDRDPCAAGLLAGARAEAPARVGRPRPGALRRTGAARQPPAPPRACSRPPPPVPPVRQVPRTTPVIARPVGRRGRRRCWRRAWLRAQPPPDPGRQPGPRRGLLRAGRPRRRRGTGGAGGCRWIALPAAPAGDQAAPPAGAPAATPAAPAPGGRPRRRLPGRRSRQLPAGSDVQHRHAAAPGQTPPAGAAGAIAPATAAGTDVVRGHAGWRGRGSRDRRAAAAGAGEGSPPAAAAPRARQIPPAGWAGLPQRPPAAAPAAAGAGTPPQGAAPAPTSGAPATAAAAAAARAAGPATATPRAPMPPAAPGPSLVRRARRPGEPGRRRCATAESLRLAPARSDGSAAAAASAPHRRPRTPDGAC